MEGEDADGWVKVTTTRLSGTCCEMNYLEEEKKYDEDAVSAAFVVAVVAAAVVAVVVSAVVDATAVTVGIEVLRLESAAAAAA